MLCKKPKSAILATQKDVSCNRKAVHVLHCPYSHYFTLLYAGHFPLLTKIQIESLENVQKLCTKMILPSSECYYERLNVLSLPPLALFRENLYRTHFLKIMSDEHHQLYSFIPERQSTCRRHSARLKDSILVRDSEQPRDRTHFL